MVAYLLLTPTPLLLTDCQVPSPPMTPSRGGRRNESTSSTTSRPRALQQLQRWPSRQGHLILVSGGEGFPPPYKLQWCRRTWLQWSQVRWSWRTWLRWSQVRWSWRTQLRWSQRSPQSCLISLLLQSRRPSLPFISWLFCMHGLPQSPLQGLLQSGNPQSPLMNPLQPRSLQSPLKSPLQSGSLQGLLQFLPR